MKRCLLLLLVVVMTMMSLVGCGNKETDQVIATVNGNEIKMSENSKYDQESKRIESIITRQTQ